MWRGVFRQFGTPVVLTTRDGRDVVLEDHPLFQGGSNYSAYLDQYQQRRIAKSKHQVSTPDESSSSVSNETNERIQDLLKDVFKDSTVISIDHKIAYILLQIFFRLAPVKTRLLFLPAPHFSIS